MSSKKKTSTTPSTNLQTLKIGSRVRCTDDGVGGRIVWANAVSVKIKWDDGEQITWRRDSLADRPIEILDLPGGEEQAAESPEPDPAGQGVSPQSSVEERPSVPPATEVGEDRSAPPATEAAVLAAEAATAELVPPLA